MASTHTEDQQHYAFLREHYTETNGPYLVSAYAVSRDWGGPEEGGWWYDNPRFLRVVGVLPTQADAMCCCRALNTALPRERLEWIMRPGEDDACDSNERLSYHVEQTAGEDELRERPHYE